VVTRIPLAGEPMKVGHDIEAKRASWSFDGNVADTFVDHVRQSVPMYDAGHELISSISDYFVRDDSVCYEIGTSTGQLLRKLATHHAHKPGVRWIGVDPVDASRTSNWSATMPSRIPTRRPTCLSRTIASSSSSRGIDRS
jgi:hypothetical protein